MAVLAVSPTTGTYYLQYGRNQTPVASPRFEGGGGGGGGLEERASPDVVVISDTAVNYAGNASRLAIAWGYLPYGSPSDALTRDIMEQMQKDGRLMPLR